MPILSDFAPQQLAVALGLALGLAFGILAERTAFCFRRSLVGEDGRQAMGVWMAALAAAVLGTQAAVAAGLISFQDHRFMAADLPVAAILVGGALFGAGMVLARGCLSRLTILGATGNLRALTVVLVAAVVAHATLKGVLAPVRTGLGSLTLPLGEAASLAALPGGAALWTALLAAGAGIVALRSGNRPQALLLGVLIGLLVPAGWLGTGWLLADEMEPLPLESLSFTGPMADSLFWFIASTSIPANFGVGLVGGTLLGSFVSALIARRIRPVSFGAPGQTGRYLAGAALMGLGGVLAGGCTIGAGLAGIPTLSVAAILALAAIAVGGLVTHRLVDAGRSREPLSAVLVRV